MSISKRIFELHDNAIRITRDLGENSYSFFYKISDNLPFPLKAAAVFIGLIAFIPALVISFAVQVLLALSGLFFGGTARVIETAAEAFSSKSHATS